MKPDSPTTINVSISVRTILLVFAIVVLVWVAFHLASVLIVVFAAIVLATAIDAPVSWMQDRRVPRPAGVLGICAVILVTLAGLGVLLIPIVGSEMRALQTDLPRYTDTIQRLVHRITPESATGGRLDVSGLSQQVTGHIQVIVLELTQLSLLAGRAVVLLFATLVMTCFLAVRPTMGTELLVRFAPPSWQGRIATISRSVRERIGNWARGQALLAVTFGLAMGVGFWLLRVPYAVSLAAIAAILEVVPYLGGAVTLILAVPLALTEGPIQAAGVVALYLVLVNLETHILAPLFFGKTVNLPPVAVFLALLIGVETAGIVGAILAIPATVIIWAIVEELWPVKRSPSNDVPQMAGLGTSAGEPSTGQRQGH